MPSSSFNLASNAQPRLCMLFNFEKWRFIDSFIHVLLYSFIESFPFHQMEIIWGKKGSKIRNVGSRSSNSSSNNKNALYNTLLEWTSKNNSGSSHTSKIQLFWHFYLFRVGRCLLLLFVVYSGIFRLINDRKLMQLFALMIIDSFGYFTLAGHCCCCFIGVMMAGAIFDKV